MFRVLNSDSSSGGWVEFKLSGPSAALEVFADFMNELGSGGAVFSEDPQRPGAQMVTVFLSADKASSDTAREIEIRLSALREEFGENWGELVITRVEDRDWASEWRQNLQPFRMDPGIWIVPTFKEIPKEADGEMVLRLDPGMAFGTGSHATTRGCLKLISAEIPRAKTMLDLGTGTAILALAALKLGMPKVVAADIDPESLRAARENAEVNGLADRIEFVKGFSDPDIPVPGAPFDLIAANIQAEALARLMPLIARSLTASGVAVLSGIITERREIVAEALAINSLSEDNRIEEEGWVTLSVRPARKTG